MDSRPVDDRYATLLSPLDVGGVALRNRIVQSAHSKLFSRNSADSRRDLEYHAERARGGVGLIVTGMRPVHPTSVPSYGRPHYPLGYVLAAIEGDRRIAAEVHRHGAAIFAQIGHFGHATSSEYGDDLRVLWAPSALPSTVFGEQPKVMELEDIVEVTAWWARSAEHAREGGFDGVELHFAHSYLVHQFLSPLFNHRDDEYGGSLDNRMRLARELAAAVRQRVGKDFVVGARLAISDFCEGGHDVEDAIAVARALVSDGSIDYASASTGGLDKSIEAAPSDIEDGWLVDKAAEFKHGLPDLPVVIVGGLRDPGHAEKILANGDGDLIAMTRALIADPELPVKIASGRESSLYRCVRANQGCIGRAFRGLPMGCTINPAAGRESLLSPRTLTSAISPGRWLVVGGGPAGMKAAEVLAQRGHAVTLLEQHDELGGQVRYAAALPGRVSYGMLIDDLRRHLESCGVDVRLGQCVSAGALLDFAAESAACGVVVATGSIPDHHGICTALPLLRELPGLSELPSMTTWDVVTHPEHAGERVVLLDDDGWRIAAGTAELLLDVGREVVLVSRFDRLLPGAATTHELPILTRRLLAKGLDVRLNSWASSVESQGVTVVNLITGAEERVRGDTLALATRPRADDTLYRQLKGQFRNLHRIGDCVAPRKIDHAIYEGTLAGRELWTTEQRTIAEAALEDWAVVGGTETLAESR